jgi:hypothetical protein
MRQNKIALCTLLVIVLSATFMAANAYTTTASQDTTTNLSVTAADGKYVTLTVKGTVDADQISELWFANNAALYNNTDIAFKLTSQNKTAEFMNMTVPKNVLLGGTSPVVTIDGALVKDSGFSQDSDNFYVWFTALSNSGHIDRSSVMITFLLTPKLTTVGPSMSYLYTMGAVVVTVLLAALFLLLVCKRYYDKQRICQQAKPV